MMKLSLKALKNINTDLMRDAIENSPLDNYLSTITVDHDGVFELELDAIMFQDGSLVSWDIEDWYLEWKDNKKEIVESEVLTFQVQKMFNTLLDGVKVKITDVYTDGRGELLYETKRQSGSGEIIIDTKKPPKYVGDIVIEGNLIPSIRSMQDGIEAYTSMSGYRSFIKNREFESVYEALQELLVQASNGNLYGEVATVIAMSILPTLAYSEVAEGIPDLIRGIQSIVEGTPSFDSYNFAIIIDDSLDTFQYELMDMR